jgi:hypothetical protein
MLNEIVVHEQHDTALYSTKNPLNSGREFFKDQLPHIIAVRHPS